MAMAFKNPCLEVFGERRSFLGGVTIPPQHPLTIQDTSDPYRIENPYYLGVDSCDYWTPPIERVMLVVGLVIVLIMSGAAAARIGESRSVRRACVANALVGASTVIVVALLASPRLTIDEILLFGVPVVSVATLLGALGGALVKKLA